MLYTDYYVLKRKKLISVEVVWTNCTTLKKDKVAGF